MPRPSIYQRWQQGPVDGGRWTVDGGRWAVGGGRWTALLLAIHLMLDQTQAYAQHRRRVSGSADANADAGAAAAQEDAGDAKADV